jgi:GAF domain-containing protein
MREKDKEMKDALQKLEKCCPGSTRVSHMQTASTELHKALLDLDRVKNQEQRLREESDALLEGMNIIINSESPLKTLKKVLEILKRLIKFDDAFVLQEQNNGSLSSVVSSSPQFENLVWSNGAMSKHVLSGNYSNIRNISYSTDWQGQPVEIRRNVTSALHTPISATTGNAMLICTSSQKGFFNKSQIQLLERFAPLAGQALYSLKIKELLRDERNKRKQAEESLEEALKERRNAKE